MNYRKCEVLHLHLDVSQMDLLIAYNYIMTPISWVIFWHIESLNNLIKPKKRAESRKHAYPCWVCSVLMYYTWIGEVSSCCLLGFQCVHFPLKPYFSHSVVHSLTELGYVVCSEALLWVSNWRCIQSKTWSSPTVAWVLPGLTKKLCTGADCDLHHQGGTAKLNT